MSKSSSGSEVFPQRLRLARELRELSQSELAARSGLQPAAVSHFETGARRPSFDNLRRLANALQVSTDYLIGRVDDIGASPTADVAFRDYTKLSERDREVIQGLIGQMAARRSDPADQDRPKPPLAGGGKGGKGDGGSRT